MFQAENNIFRIIKVHLRPNLALKRSNLIEFVHKFWILPNSTIEIRLYNPKFWNSNEFFRAYCQPYLGIIVFSGPFEKLVKLWHQFTFYISSKNDLALPNRSTLTLPRATFHSPWGQKLQYVFLVYEMPDNFLNVTFKMKFGTPKVHIARRNYLSWKKYYCFIKTLTGLALKVSIKNNAE